VELPDREYRGVAPRGVPGERDEPVGDLGVRRDDQHGFRSMLRLMMSKTKPMRLASPIAVPPNFITII
jgi:hypothetical protein